MAVCWGLGGLSSLGAAGLLMPAGGHLAAEFGLFALADSFSVFFLRFSILEFNWMI